MGSSLIVVWIFFVFYGLLLHFHYIIFLVSLFGANLTACRFFWLVGVDEYFAVNRTRMQNCNF